MQCNVIQNVIKISFLHSTRVPTAIKASSWTPPTLDMFNIPSNAFIHDSDTFVISSFFSFLNVALK